MKSDSVALMEVISYIRPLVRDASIYDNALSEYFVQLNK